MGLELLHATSAPVVGGLTGIGQPTSFKTIVSDYTSSKCNSFERGRRPFPPFEVFISWCFSFLAEGFVPFAFNLKGS